MNSTHRNRPLMFAAIVALLTLLLGISTVSANDFGAEEPGRHVYDRAGLLTEDEVNNLEQLAADVDAAGAPVVVFLRPEEADVDETLDDGRDLMEAWDVQTESGARDGVVIFLNLDPDELRRGQLALIAGESHFDGGNLPQYQLDRIRDAMIDELSEDRTAEGIATGLRMIAESLEFGPGPPPEPTRFEEISEDIAGGILSPLNALAALVVAGVAFVWRNLWRTSPKSSVPATPVTTPPNNLIPAAAGALVTRNVGVTQIEATILDLARRGALAFEPEPDEDEKNIQIRLLDRSVLENEFESEVWSALEPHADDSGIISSKALNDARWKFDAARDSLRSHLENSGWFDPEAASRRWPLYIAGGIAVLLGVAGLIFTVAVENIWGLAGTVALGGMGLAAIVAAGSYPETTPEGEDAAQPWRGYLKGIKEARKNRQVYIDLDEAVPYLTAMNAGNELDDRLKRASEEGYSPAWLNNTGTGASWGTAGFYPYWIMFHSVATTTAATTGAGASVGSGGSGGSF